MPDVLDQTEIDALLNAVDGTGDAAGLGGDGPARRDPAKRPADVAAYDFRRPERVGKEQARALETLHDAFARNFGASLSGFLRTIVEVRVSQVEQLSYGEFAASLPNPTCFHLVGGEQGGRALDGQVCLELSPLIVYPIIDRSLGGSDGDLFIPQRPLTQIEQRLIQRVTDRAMHHLGEAWSQILPTTFAVEAFESNPQLVQSVPPNETTVVVGFEIKLGRRAGTMSLCLPYQAIEPMMGRVQQQSWMASAGRRSAAGEGAGERLGEGLAAAPVELRATLARTTLTLGELMGLKAGDVITTDKPATGDVAVSLGGRGKFAGKLGQFRGNKAVRITRVLPPPPEPAAKAE